MNEESYLDNIQVIGSRVLVEKERIDSGAFNLTPAMESEGEKNKGKILSVGQVGLMDRLRGLRKGRTIIFKKHFVLNHADGETPLVFVDTENILAIL